MSGDFYRFGSFVVSDDAPRIGETDNQGDLARVVVKIVNPLDKHQRWYVVEVDPDGTAFGWFQMFRDHGFYGKFDLRQLSHSGMIQQEISGETIRSMREYGHMG